MTTAAVFHRAALAAWQIGDWESAIGAARSGLQFEPDHGGLHELAGLAEYEMENFGPAANALQTASILAPMGVPAQLALADCYLRFGQVISARAIFNFLAEIDRCPTPLLPNVAKGFGRLGAYEEALEVCERLTELRPTYHPAWFGIAYYQAKLEGSLADILPALQVAYELAPEAITYRLSLASAYLDAGELDRAHGLIRDLPAESVRCPLMVNRFIRVFAAAGNAGRVREYESWFVRMAESSRKRGNCPCQPDTEDELPL